MSEWESKVVLQRGESLTRTGSRQTGFMQETDIDNYDVVDGDGNTNGTVEIRDHTAVRGLRRTITVIQRDSSGKIVVNEVWNP